MFEPTMIVESLSPGDRECVDIALSIAVSCREPSGKAFHPLGKRCGSAPGNLNLLLHRPSIRRSPKQARHRFQRRCTTDQTCTKEKLDSKTGSCLDLSSLNFSFSEPAEQVGPLSVSMNEQLSIGLNEHGITPKGVEHISRALSFVRLEDTKPLIQLQLAYNSLGDEGIASLMWAATQGSLLHLRRLVLTGNRLVRMSGLATALSAGYLADLTDLHLSSNRIQSDGIADLANAKLANQSAALSKLTTLGLDHNQISEAKLYGPSIDVTRSVAALGRLANACSHLRVLELGSNGLGDAHLQALALAIDSGGAFAAHRADRNQESDKESERDGARSMARLDLSLNCHSLSAHQQLHAACEVHGGVECVM